MTIKIPLKVKCDYYDLNNQDEKYDGCRNTCEGFLHFKCLINVGHEKVPIVSAFDFNEKTEGVHLPSGWKVFVKDYIDECLPDVRTFCPEHASKENE